MKHGLARFAATLVIAAVLAPITGCGFGDDIARLGRNAPQLFPDQSADDLLRLARQAEVGAERNALKQFADDQLRAAEVAAAQRAELAHARQDPRQREAVEAVCNIGVDFAVPPVIDDPDGSEASAVQRLVEATAGEADTYGIKSYAERAQNAWILATGTPDEQIQAAAKLERDAMVVLFQAIYCSE